MIQHLETWGKPWTATCRAASQVRCSSCCCQKIFRSQGRHGQFGGLSPWRSILSSTECSDCFRALLKIKHALQAPGKVISQDGDLSLTWQQTSAGLVQLPTCQPSASHAASKTLSSRSFILPMITVLFKNCCRQVPTGLAMPYEIAVWPVIQPLMKESELLHEQLAAACPAVQVNGFVQPAVAIPNTDTVRREDRCLLSHLYDHSC